MLTTRTLNPLPFEHLEPHRFEDLVRQLVYDFRTWRSLEATGRSGQDEGVDIRGITVVDQIDDEAASIDETVGPGSDQIWIIQCKREKTIGPKQLTRYAAEVLAGNKNIHGFLFVASSDFSVKARDAFRAEALAHGVREVHLWGRSEIEDRLFRPEYDHLLFAYFGLSLNVRRRSLRMELNRGIALKRKLISFAPLDNPALRPVLLRDPTDKSYPYISDFDTFKLNPGWMYYDPEGHYPVDHLSFNVCMRDGWVNWETGEWDIPRIGPSYHHAERLHGARDSWESERAVLDPLRELIPPEHLAIVKIIQWISYDRILSVDEIGDGFNAGPHLLVERNPEYGFFEPGAHAYAYTRGGHNKSLSWAQQINFFPPKQKAG